MFSIPIDVLTFEDVNNFCQARVREGLVLDYKLDFPQHLGKTIASFANTYGGHILIGVDETATGEPVLPIAGVPLQSGLRERVVAIALDAINPPIYPEVRVLEFSSPGATTKDRAVIMVRVHESQDGAHAVDQGTSVYLRVDNISKHFTRKATIDEIGWLTNKRQKSIAFKEQLVETARARTCSHVETWRVSRRLPWEEPRRNFVLWTAPKFPRSELVSPQKLFDFSRRADWGQQVADIDFPYGNASPIADGIRHPAAHGHNYWYTEVNRYGLVYSRIGFTLLNPEGAISFQILAQLLVAGLKFSINLYENHLGYFGLVDFHYSVEPTRNCFPLFWEGNANEDKRCLDDTVSAKFTDTVRNVHDSLIDRARESYRQVLWAFGMNLNSESVTSHFRLFGIA